jgi:hypothetical protein
MNWIGRRLLPLALVLASLPAAAVARTWYVNPAGNDTTGTGSSDAPFATLARAVSASASGDTIRVDPGRYEECVGAPDKTLSLVATAIEADEPSNTVTIVDATGVCGGRYCKLRRSLTCYGNDAATCEGICDDSVCSTTQTQHCLLDSDCPSGENCSVTVTEGVCSNDDAVSCTADTCVIASGETTGKCKTHTTVSCDADSDCRDIDCNFGACRRIHGSCSTSGAWCTTGADCPEGQDCDAIALAPVLDLGPGSSVTGFTVLGGGLSGVRISGSGTVRENLISSNFSAAGDGGGVLVVPAVTPQSLRCWRGPGLACESDAGCRVCSDDASLTCVADQDCADAGAGPTCNDLGPCLATTVVSVQGNVIRNNVADTGGGGLSVRTSLAAASAMRLLAVGNTFSGNTTQGDGGALLALVAGEGRFIARIENDTVTGNQGADGGGIAVKAALTGDAAAADLALIGSTIEANEASGSGGGALLDFGVDGTVRIAAGGNAVRGNTADLDGGGLLARAAGDGPGIRSMDVGENGITGNTAGRSGGGLDLALTSGAASTEEGSVEVNGNDVAGNSCAVGGGGLRATLVSSGAAAGATLAVGTNTFRRNTAASFGGGVAIVTNSEGAAGAAATFTRNLVAENAATNADEGAATGGGLFLYCRGGAGTASVAVDFATIASNFADAGAAAIEIESDGVPGGSESVAISNSILSGNDGIAVGGPHASKNGKMMQGGARDLHVNVTYTDVYGNTAIDFERTLKGELTHDASDIAVDPMLTFDFSPALCSGAIDAADPAADYSLEPQPNGQRADLGFLGGTTGATPTLPDTNRDGLVDGIDLITIASAFASDRQSTPARFYAAADLDGNGIVDGQDLAYVAAFFGFQCP